MPDRFDSLKSLHGKRRSEGAPQAEGHPPEQPAYKPRHQVPRHSGISLAQRIVLSACAPVVITFLAVGQAGNWPNQCRTATVLGQIRAQCDTDWQIWLTASLIVSVFEFWLWRNQPANSL